MTSQGAQREIQQLVVRRGLFGEETVPGGSKRRTRQVHRVDHVSFRDHLVHQPATDSDSARDVGVW